MCYPNQYEETLCPPCSENFFSIVFADQRGAELNVVALHVKAVTANIVCLLH